jgi:flagellar protein FliL
MAEAAKAAPEEASAAPAPEKKSRKLLFIIIAAAVLLAGGGGAAAYLLAGNHDEEVASADDEADEADAKPAKTKDAKASANDKKAKDKKAKKKPAKPRAPALYVKLDPPFVVNFEAKGLMRFLQVQVEIMTRDPATADLLKLHDPVIRNDLLMLLGNQTHEMVSSREGKEKLRLEALKAIGQIVSNEGGDAKLVEQLYFTSFVMQ